MWDGDGHGDRNDVKDWNGGLSNESPPLTYQHDGVIISVVQGPERSMSATAMVAPKSEFWRLHKVKRTLKALAGGEVGPEQILSNAVKALRNCGSSQVLALDQIRGPLLSNGFSCGYNQKLTAFNNGGWMGGCNHPVEAAATWLKFGKDYGDPQAAYGATVGWHQYTSPSLTGSVWGRMAVCGTSGRHEIWYFRKVTPFEWVKSYTQNVPAGWIGEIIYNKCSGLKYFYRVRGISSIGSYHHYFVTYA